MTNEEKNKIMQMRESGLGYTRIAQELGLSKNTVSSFCRRNSLTGEGAVTPRISPAEKTNEKPCLCCGAPVRQNPNRNGLISDVEFEQICAGYDAKISPKNFHEAPNEKCPVGRNIHAVLDGRLRNMQEALENEMKRTSLADLLTETEQLIEKQK